MVSGSGADDSGGREFNLDDLEIDILILAKNPNQLKNTCAFLNRRGWVATAVGSVTKAIEYISEKHPDFVLISYNHPNPAIPKLADMVTKNFGVEAVGYVEGVDPNSIQKLTNVKMRHKIFGQPSGPNIQRGIRRILCEKLDIQVEARSAVVELGGAKKKQRGALVFAGQKGSSAPSHTIVNAGTKSENHQAVQQGRKSSAKLKLRDLESEKQKLRLSLEPDKSKKLAEEMKTSLLGEGDDASDAEPDVRQQEEAMRAFEAATAEAFEGIGNGSTAEPSLLGGVSQFGVFPVHSETTPGYLVVAFESGHESALKDFLKTAEGALIKSLRAAGIAGSVEAGFWLDLPAVNFENWSQSSATFSFKSEFDGLRFGAVFFQLPKQLTKPNQAPGEMVSVSVAEISTDYPVNFKAYLRLPANNKYFLYLRNGRLLQPEQKERLLEKNVTELFMKGVDLQNLRMFIALAFLSDTIKEAA